MVNFFTSYIRWQKKGKEYNVHSNKYLYFNFRTMSSTTPQVMGEWDFVEHQNNQVSQKPEFSQLAHEIATDTSRVSREILSWEMFQKAIGEISTPLRATVLAILTAVSSTAYAWWNAHAEASIGKPNDKHWAWLTMMTPERSAEIEAENQRLITEKEIHEKLSQTWVNPSLIQTVAELSAKNLEDIKAWKLPEWYILKREPVWPIMERADLSQIANDLSKAPETTFEELWLWDWLLSRDNVWEFLEILFNPDDVPVWKSNYAWVLLADLDDWSLEKYKKSINISKKRYIKRFVVNQQPDVQKAKVDKLKGKPQSIIDKVKLANKNFIEQLDRTIAYYNEWFWKLITPVSREWLRRLLVSSSTLAYTETFWKDKLAKWKITPTLATQAAEYILLTNREATWLKLTYADLKYLAVPDDLLAWLNPDFANVNELTIALMTKWIEKKTKKWLLIADNARLDADNARLDTDIARLKANTANNLDMLERDLNATIAVINWWILDYLKFKDISKIDRIDEKIIELKSFISKIEKDWQLRESTREIWVALLDNYSQIQS